MAKNFELESLIGSEFLSGSPVNNTFKISTDGKDRFFSVECYAPMPKGDIFSFAHCYNVMLKNDTDKTIADVIYDGEVDESCSSTNVTFVNAKGEVLYSIFAYEGRHTSDVVKHYGKVWVKEISGTKVVGVHELV